MEPKAAPPAPPFRMPAEWEPHAATLLAWPHEVTDWPGKFAPIPWVYTQIIRRLLASEPVLLLVEPASEKSVQGVLKKAGVDSRDITFLPCATDRVWVRDSGPTIVRDASGRNLALDWQFNAWAKYDNWHRDELVPSIIADHLHVPLVQPRLNDARIVLEGGSIDVNGAGLMLTTEECLLSDVQCRNPGLTRDDYERVFAEYLGVTKTLWLGRGIAGDDTHGHVDDLARFVGSRTVVAVVERNPADPNYQPLQENLERLRGTTDTDGKAIEVVELPMPQPLMFRGQRLPASYANFYIGNSVVLVPTFDDSDDRIALGILADLFPSRQVVGIHSVDLVWGFGTLHCLSQQIPA